VPSAKCSHALLFPAVANTVRDLVSAFVTVLVCLLFLSPDHGARTPAEAEAARLRLARAAAVAATKALPISLQTLAGERYVVRNWSRKSWCCRKVDFRAIAAAQHPELGRFATWGVLPPGCSVPMTSYQPADALAVLWERLEASEPTDTPWTIVWDVSTTPERASMGFSGEFEGSLII